jgi:hypothetical protein
VLPSRESIVESLGAGATPAAGSIVNARLSEPERSRGIVAADAAMTTPTGGDHASRHDVGGPGGRGVGIVAVLMANVFWSFGGVLGKSTEASGEVLSFWRMWVATGMMLVVAATMRRLPTWIDIRRAAPFGVLFGLNICALASVAVAASGRVTAGELLGVMGQTGNARASECHTHLGISRPCPEPEWKVRRGEVWPAPYLDAWRDGEQASPAAEVEALRAELPHACIEAAALLPSE